MDDQNTQNTSVKEQTPKQQVVESLKNASNVLVTISNNPTVDQLAACIGLTLMMSKLDKHATAVFSGAIPSTIEFLEPEKTIEKNTDSLRDFIISLDKSKADKLRYKVEDEVVRIYITPYKTSIGQADLDFTQGDFNVDVVVALGIDNKDQLDGAIMEHGQILHDATVIDMSCSNNRPVDMGSINWHDGAASSLCEMLVSISEAFQTGLLDTQMSTALLTGIVAETDRFSNDKTTPKVMTMSAQLMAAGANQQLIANQLEIKPAEPETTPPMPESVAKSAVPGELEIDHTETPEPEKTVPAPPEEIPASQNPEPVTAINQSAPHDEDTPEEDHLTVSVDDAASVLGASGTDVTETASDATDQASDNKTETSPIEIDELGVMVDLKAAAEERAYEHKQKVIQPLGFDPNKPKTDLSTVSFDDPMTNQPPVVDRQTSAESAHAAALEAAASKDAIPNPAFAGDQTLEELEKAVDSPHVAKVADAEQKAMAEAGYVPAAPSTMPQFPLPEPLPEESIGAPETQQLAPPPLPPPFVPPYMQPQPVQQVPVNDELNLPEPK